MKRFPKGRGIIGVLLLALLAACAIFAWSAALPTSGTDARSVHPDDAALAVVCMFGEHPAFADGAMPGGPNDADVTTRIAPFDGKMTNNAPGESRQTPNNNGGAVGENGTTDEANSSGVLPWIIALLVILSIVLVVLALIPKKNRSH